MATYSYYDTDSNKEFEIGKDSGSISELVQAVGLWMLDDPATHAILNQEGINPIRWLRELNARRISEWFPELIIQTNN